ncbi:MAG: MFS transporter [Candidatus Abyssubacteria bacterium]
MSDSKAYSKWLIALTGFLSLTVAGGIGWFVFPVYLTLIQNELGVTRAQISFPVTVWALMGAACSPLVGVWIDKYGPRRVMLIGTACQVIATLLLGRITALWHIYALFILSSFANASNTYIPIGAAISQNFEKNRGKAMGLALLGMGVGGFAAPVLADLFLRHYSWRTGYFLFSLFLLALLVPIALWIPSKRRSAGQPETDISAVEVEGGSEGLVSNSLNIREASRTRSLWALSAGDFLIAIVYTSMLVHLVPFATDNNISLSKATLIYGSMQAVILVGTFLFGAAADRIKIRTMMILCYGGTGLAMLLLLRNPSVAMLFTFAIMFGLPGGGRNALWPLALGESFGVDNLGSILGWLNIPFTLGNAIGPYLAGYIFDSAGSYRLFFQLAIGISLLSALFISGMRNERRPHVQVMPVRELVG